MFLATHSAGGGRSAMSDSNLEDLAGPKRVRTRNAVGGGERRPGPRCLEARRGGQKITYPSCLRGTRIEGSEKNLAPKNFIPTGHLPRNKNPEKSGVGKDGVIK